MLKLYKIHHESPLGNINLIYDYSISFAADQYAKWYDTITNHQHLDFYFEITIEDVVGEKSRWKVYGKKKISYDYSSTPIEEN